jgi:hypothetical protein
MRIGVPALLFLAVTSHPQTGHADASYQMLPFMQDWSNTSLLSANDDWSSVPGVVGYLGDDASSSEPGRDPTSVIAGDVTSVDLISNQADPSTLIPGGVAEFQLADPVVALQGSATADFPSLVFHVNAAGFSGITLFCNLRDLDGSLDDAVQQIAVQFRVGSSGPWSNTLGGYFSDVTTGPGEATLVTSVAVQLPAVANNRPQLQIRVLTTNSAGGPLGNDEWVGIDDIVITSSNSGVPVEATTWGSLKARGR